MHNIQELVRNYIYLGSLLKLKYLSFLFMLSALNTIKSYRLDMNKPLN